MNFAYTGGGEDGAGTGLDRTTEGYVEIIEMATYFDDSETAANVTHVDGVPADCGAQTDALGDAEAQPPTGGLMGGITLINVNSGSDYTADAVALDNYSDTELYTGAGVTTPDLQEASPPTSIVVANNNVYTSDWTPGPDAVSAVLMHDHVMNEFVLDAGTQSGTDWVVTMPTKRFYVFNDFVAKLFQRNFDGANGACDDVSLNIYDREEQTTFDAAGLLAAAAGRHQRAVLGSERHHVQEFERAGLGEPRQRPDGVRKRLARPRLPPGYRVRRGAHSCQLRHDDCPAGWRTCTEFGYIRRPAGGWLCGSVVRQRRDHRQWREHAVELRRKLRSQRHASDLRSTLARSGLLRALIWKG